MRLSILEKGHKLRWKAFMAITRLTGGYETPGVVKTLLYRPEFFGHAQSKLTQRIMRGASPWKVGERELFACFVSAVNQCPF
jgi:hypothetical protein